MKYNLISFPRKLIMFKMFVSNLYPLLLLIFGVRKVYELRHNNYGCGDGNEPENKPDEGAWFGFYSALLITYALELLVWSAVIANQIIRVLRRRSFLVRSSVEGSQRMAERLEGYVGLLLRCLQFIHCNKTDFRNQGELKEFASHFVSAS